MRNGLAGFFVLGTMLPVVVLTVAFAGYSVFGRTLQWNESAAVVVATGAAYLLARIVAAWIVEAHSRRRRPHTLFTPLYDQRPHDWALRAA